MAFVVTGTVTLGDLIEGQEGRKGEAMFKVPCGQDPYNAIGNYIEDHITAIEDIIAVIEIDGVKTNQLLMVDMQPDRYFIWDNDWWEGEENIVLIDFFPVSDAQKSRGKGKWLYIDDDDLIYDTYQCTCCKRYVTVDAERKCDIGFIIDDFDFCPHCGADMRESDIMREADAFCF